jgi:nicotinamide-nucleotide amidase
MRAETVSVGTELLLGQIVDTNAAALATVLAECGLAQTHRQTVGDNLSRLTAALREALARAEVVVTIGGLGPTADDLTRDGIAAALGDTLVEDPAVVEHLRAQFEKRRIPWVDSIRRQALRPTCARIVSNPNGSAPGLVCERDGKTVIALPGPRNEFVPMLEGPVRDELLRLGGGSAIVSRVLKVVGIGESMVEEKLGDLMAGDDPTLAPYAKTGEVHLRLTTRASSPEQAAARLDPLAAAVRARLGDAVYGEGDDTLESALVSLLRGTNQTVAFAESCTGGGAMRRLTSVPGSSDVLVGGWVTYADEAKSSWLGVSAETLREHGAVSAECAAEMAEGARSRADTTYGVSVTGVAGPGGGTEEKPVGLVFVGLASPGITETHRFLFPGGREAVRERSVQAALAALRAAALGDRSRG